MIHLLLALCFCALQHHCFAAHLGSEPYLLFSTWFTLSRVNLDGSNYSVLVDSTTNTGIQAVGYHQRLNKAFWTHYRDGTIHQANLNGSDPTIIVCNVPRPSGLAVDWIHDTIYYAYGDSMTSLRQFDTGGCSVTINPNHLAVYDITTGATSEITAAINQLYGVFHDLAVDPLEGKLYWTTGSRIIQSSLSGENAKVLFSPSCNARYLGLSTNLYWTQSCSGSEESVHCLDLTTLQQTVIVTNNANTFYSDVTAYEDTVYWTLLGHVNSAPVIGGNVTTQLLHIPSVSTNLRGIVVVHPDLQSCPGTDCSYYVQSSRDISPISTNTPNHVESPYPPPTSSDKDIVPVGLTVTAVVIIVVLLFVPFGIIAVIVLKKLNKARNESTLPSTEDTDIVTGHNTVYNIFDKSRPAANNKNDERMYPANTAEDIVTGHNTVYNIFEKPRPAENNKNDERMYPANTAEDIVTGHNTVYNIFDKPRPAVKNRNDIRMYPTNTAEVVAASDAPLYEEIYESSFVPNTNDSDYEN